MIAFLREWWIAVLSVIGTIVAVGALLLAYPSFKRTADYAEQGRQVRARQVKIAPISCLNYRDQLARGVITVQQFRYAVSEQAGFPGDCPIAPGLVKP